MFPGQPHDFGVAKARAGIASLPRRRAPSPTRTGVRLFRRNRGGQTNDSMLLLDVAGRLTDAALAVSPQRLGLTATTTRAGHAEWVFAKVAPTAQSIMRL